MKKILILLIDDDQTLVDFMATCLKTYGYETDRAHSGKEGLTKAKKIRPDLVILDLLMPGMHGFDVCQQLRLDPDLKGMKILISSAKGYDVDRRSAERVGADSYLKKPFDAQRFVAEVKSLVGEP